MHTNLCLELGVHARESDRALTCWADNTRGLNVRVLCRSHEVSIRIGEIRGDAHLAVSDSDERQRRLASATADEERLRILITLCIRQERVECAECPFIRIPASRGRAVSVRVEPETLSES